MTSPARAWFRLLVTAVVSAALVLAHQAPSHADEHGELGEIIGTPIVIDLSGVITGAIDVTTVTPIMSGCANLDGIAPTAISSSLVVCTGGQGPVQPLVVSGAGDTIFQGSLDAPNALGWIQQEAVDVIATTYGLPRDGRIERYARDTIRAYAHYRLLDILDKAVYDQPMTAQETGALTYLQGRVLGERRELTRLAVAEYDKWKELDCGYYPPAAPSYDTAPVGLSAGHKTSCLGARSVLATQFNLGTSAPTVEQFQAWAGYRYGAERLAVLENATVRAQLSDAALAGIGLGGIAVAVGAGGIASLAVGSSVAAATVAAKIMGSFAVTKLAAGGAMKAFFAAAVPGIGAGAAAGIVTIVLLFVVVTVMAALHFAQRDQVGAELEKQHTDAEAATDPFKIAEMKATYGQLDFLENIDTNPPYHRSATSGITELLWRQVAADSLSTSLGQPVIDPVGTFAPDPSTIGDFRLRTIATGVQPQDHDAIEVRAGDGQWQEISFENFWLQVIPDEGSASAELSFDYRDPQDGKTKIATRAPGTTLQWIVSEFDGDSAEGTLTSALRVETRAGARNLSLRAPAPGFGTMYPAAVGLKLPGRTMGFRPNPVDTDGSFDPALFSGPGYTYAWQIQRISGGVAETVTNLSGYAPAFVPTQPGSYVANVTMTPPSGPTVSASVPFVVDVPEITSSEVNLVDDGVVLALDIAATERAADDTFTIDVTWPRAGNGVAPTTQVTGVACQAFLPDGCVLATTGPQEAQLTHTPGPLAYLDDPITVTITNSHGQKVVQELRIDSEARPEVMAPNPALLDGFTTPHAAKVSYSNRTAYVQVPFKQSMNAQVATVRSTPGNENFLIMYDEVRDGWYGDAILLDDEHTLTLSILPGNETGVRQLVLFAGALDVEAVGTYRVRVPLSDGGSNSNLDVVVDVVPALNDLNRAWLLVDEDAGDYDVPRYIPDVVGGRDDAPYTGDYCSRMQDLNNGEWSPEICRPLSALSSGSDVPRFPLPDMFPEGLRDVPYRLHMRLPQSELSTDLETTHLIYYDTAGAPTVGGVQWNDKTLVASVPITPSAPAAPITRTTCWLDGKPLKSCVPLAGGALELGNVTLGQHTLRVLATDATGNYQRRDLTFTRSLVKAKLPVKAGKGTFRAGKDKVRVRASALAPRERYTVRIGPRKVAKGKANANGKVDRRLTVPARTASGKVAVRVVGGRTDRVGKATIRVTRGGQRTVAEARSLPGGHVAR